MTNCSQKSLDGFLHRQFDVGESLGPAGATWLTEHANPKVHLARAVLLAGYRTGFPLKTHLMACPDYRENAAEVQRLWNTNMRSNNTNEFVKALQYNVHARS